MTLTKAELVQGIVDSLGLTNREGKDMVEAFFDEISAGLEGGEEVKLHGFGNFVLMDKPERPGRNPKTGEDVAILARRVVAFRPSPLLKDAVVGYVDNAVAENA